MPVLRVAAAPENGTVALRHSLSALLDEFNIKFVLSDALHQNHSNETFSSHGDDNLMYHLVKNGQADTMYFPAVPSLLLLDTFAFSNVFDQMDQYLLYAKDPPSVIDVNAIMANVNGSVFIAAVALILLISIVHLMAFNLLKMTEVTDANVNWWTVLMVTTPCFSCQGVLSLAHHGRGKIT